MSTVYRQLDTVLDRLATNSLLYIFTFKKYYKWTTCLQKKSNQASS